MTAKKDLKRRVRERQAQTGESYVTARRHVVSQAPDTKAADPAKPPELTRFESEANAAMEPSAKAIDFDEMIDLTEAGASLGFHCRIYASSKLGRLVAHDVLLRRIREILDATTEDAGMAHFRAVILRGQRPAFPARGADWLESLRRFVARAQAGIGGISEAGNMLAFSHGPTIVLANIGYRPPSTTMSDIPPRLALSALAEDGFSMSWLYTR